VTAVHIFVTVTGIYSFIDTCMYIKTLCATEDTGYLESCFFNPHKSWVRRQAMQFGTKNMPLWNTRGEEIANIIVQWRYLWCNNRTLGGFFWWSFEGLWWENFLYCFAFGWRERIFFDCVKSAVLSQECTVTEFGKLFHYKVVHMGQSVILNFILYLREEYPGSFSLNRVSELQLY
jgi:hypothetical protein